VLSGIAESLLPGGEALVRANDGVFLVANAVPGDRIQFEKLGRQRGAERARLVEVLESSPFRVSPPCPVATECGGCALQFLEPSRHAEVKSEWVREAFRNCVNEGSAWIPASDASPNSRRRLRWYVGRDDAGLFLGFRAANSHRVVRHAQCLCATDALNSLRNAIENSLDLKPYDAVQAVHLSDGIHLILESGKSADEFEPPFEAIEALPVQWWQRKGDVTRPFRSPAIKFHDLIPSAVGTKLAIRIGPDDFIQGQEEGNCVIIRQLIDWCEGARFVVDLFCGVGNLSLPVAAGGVRVIGAELNPASVKAANANAKALKVDVKYVQANLFESFDCESFAGADVLILDPPRRGAKKACSMMGRLLPAKIVMVNCDVASGGRDGEILQSLGYRMKALRALDLFPYTGHVEAMSLWVR